MSVYMLVCMHACLSVCGSSVPGVCLSVCRIVCLYILVCLFLVFRNAYVCPHAFLLFLRHIFKIKFMKSVYLLVSCFHFCLFRSFSLSPSLLISPSPSLSLSPSPLSPSLPPPLSPPSLSLSPHLSPSLGITPFSSVV
jgi:hypothetical protein